MGLRALIGVGYILFLVACQTSPIAQRDVLSLSNLTECRQILKKADWSREVTLMSTIQELFENRCDSETLQLGKQLREKLRDKYYSFTSEILSILGPEEMSQTYVLESHERVYINLLMAMSYLRLGKLVEGRVELRRAGDELNAILYNHGRDRVTSALLASLWVGLGEKDLAAPYWRMAGLDSFAERSDLDSQPLHIYAIGHFEGYDWSLGGKETMYKIQPKTALPQSCQSNTGALVPIDDWVQKIKVRHQSDYRPLLNFKSWVRLPIGIGYGAFLATSGVGIAVLGCAGSKDNAEACRAGIEVGGALIGMVPDAFSYPVQPDLRHWPSSPVGFLVTRANHLHEETCLVKNMPVRSLWGQAARPIGRRCVRGGLCPFM